MKVKSLYKVVKMQDYDDLLEILTRENSTAKDRSAALNQLKAEPGTRDWLSDSAIGAGTIGVGLGAGLPLSKKLLKLAQKRVWQKTAAKAPSAIDEEIGAGNLAFGGGAGGALLGYGAGTAMQPVEGYLDSGRMDEELFGAMLKTLKDREASKEDKALARDALLAQGESASDSGLSRAGEAAALGSLGAILGGLGTSKILKGMRTGPDSGLTSATTALFGRGAADSPTLLRKTADNYGDTIGGFAGAGLGTMLPYMGEQEAPEQYSAAVRKLHDTGEGGQELEENYNKTDMPMGEMLGGALGGTAGFLAGRAAHPVGGWKGVGRGLNALIRGKNPRESLVKSALRKNAAYEATPSLQRDSADLMDEALSAGYGASGGAGLGALVSADYSSPFRNEEI